MEACVRENGRKGLATQREYAKMATGLATQYHPDLHGPAVSPNRVAGVVDRVGPLMVLIP